MSLVARACVPQPQCWSLCVCTADSFRYSCDICGKKYKYYSCFQEHRDLHAVDGNLSFLFTTRTKNIFNTLNYLCLIVPMSQNVTRG